jgi:hypothetical protein
LRDGGHLLVGVTLFAVYWNLLNSMKESAR